ncbi:Protein FAR1-RELATED SEQUENCE 5, partial [Bienertia sinuspersici]
MIMNNKKKKNKRNKHNKPETLILFHMNSKKKNTQATIYNKVHARRKQKNKIKGKKRKPRQLPITRRGCKAFIRAKLNKEGLFEIVKLVLKHNHELTKKEWQHSHRSERKITDEKAITIDLMSDSGLRPTQLFNLMAHEAG